MAVDWRKIFILYSGHVIECAGEDFLGPDDEWPPFLEGITNIEEREAAVEARNLIRDEYAAEHPDNRIIGTRSGIGT